MALVAALALPACAMDGHAGDEDATFGRQVFEQKCWGCHHETSQAFGPSFQWIARNRTDAVIRAQLTDPASVAPSLGYARSAMPKLGLSEREMRAVVAFVRRAGDLEPRHAANEPVHQGGAPGR